MQYIQYTTLKFSVIFICWSHAQKQVIWPPIYLCNFSYCQVVVGVAYKIMSACNFSVNCLLIFSFLYIQVRIISFLNLQISYDDTTEGQQQPTLQLISDLLNSITVAMERVAEEKYMLLNKVSDANMFTCSLCMLYYWGNFKFWKYVLNLKFEVELLIHSRSSFEHLAEHNDFSATMH